MGETIALSQLRIRKQSNPLESNKERKPGGTYGETEIRSNICSRMHLILGNFLGVKENFGEKAHCVKFG